MPSFSFSNFVYFDTNIILEIAKNKTLWKDLYTFLEQNDLTMGLSTGQIAEIADAKKLHQPLVGLFLSVPTALLKVWDEIVNEEIESHPNERTKTLMMYPLNAILAEKNGIDKLFNFLSSGNLANARNQQKTLATKMNQRHQQLKGNFSPSKSGKYEKEQASSFADVLVIQMLANINRQFLVDMNKDISLLHLEVFKSIRTYAFVLFYKYYLGNREPSKLSDFGDLGHLFYLPYCKLIVMERDLCTILNQIKQNQDVLENSIIKNIEFLKNWDY